MLKINGIKYEIIYTYYYSMGHTSASPILVPIELRKVEVL